MIKFVIFDFDGVIEDNYELHYQLTSKKYTNLTREEHRRLFEGNILLEIEKIKSRDNGFDHGTPFQNAKINAKIKPEIKYLLIELASKYKLGIISSAKEFGINSFLSNNNVLSLFSFIFGFETNKLKCDKFKKVFTDFKVSKEECIFITDTLGDILEAKKVGIRTIAIDFGYHERARLEKGKPFAIISGFSELIKVINSVK